MVKTDFYFCELLQLVFTKRAAVFWCIDPVQSVSQCKVTSIRHLICCDIVVVMAAYSSVSKAMEVFHPQIQALPSYYKQ